MLLPMDPYIIRIYYECEGRIEKFVPGIAIRLASGGLPSDDSDHEVQIFLSYPHTNNELFFLLTTFCLF